MDLDFQQRRDLARLLAGRLPGYAQRSRVASDAGVAGSAQLSGDPLACWVDIVDRASGAGSVPKLLRSASGLRPGDWRLRRAAAAAGEGRLALGVSPLWFVAAAALVAVIGGGMLGARSAARATAAQASLVEPAPAAQAEPAPQPAEGGAEGDGAEEDGAEDDGAALLAASVAPRSEPDGDDRAADGGLAAGDQAAGAPAAIDRPDALSPAGSTDRCHSGPGDIAGFWYTTLDLSPGTVHTLTHGVNVRADYPRAENGWSSRASVVCVLKAGDRVTVSRTPIEVGRGYRWVPLSRGDLR